MPTAQTPYSLRAFFPIPCVIVSSWHWEGLWPTNDHGVSEDVKILHEMGYAQELSRRMGAFQNFAISFAIICIVAGGLTAFPAALSAGGGAAIGVMWVVGSIFALVVAVAMGQVAPSYPTAGGIYHWLRSSAAAASAGRRHGSICDHRRHPALRAA